MKKLKYLFSVILIICSIFFSSCSNNDSNKDNITDKTSIEKPTPFEKLQSYILDNYDSSETEGLVNTYIITIDTIEKNNTKCVITTEFTDDIIPTIKLCYIYMTNNMEYTNFVYFNIYNYDKFIEFDCFNEKYYYYSTFEEYQFYSYKIFPSLFTSEFKIDKYISTNQEITDDNIESCSLSTQILVLTFRSLLNRVPNLSIDDFGFTQL